MPSLISIIIPTLNEEGNIGRTLSSLAGVADIEVIVVDGGSMDNTVQKAVEAGTRVITTSPGRAVQMNRGAAAANGDILLFLHSDTLLPTGFADFIRAALLIPQTLAGAFTLRIAEEGPGLRVVEWLVRWRSFLFHMVYGDQALFLTADKFHAIGGFPEQPFMEDFEFVRQLRKKGRIVILPQVVITSGRKWQQRGVFTTTVINQVIILGYLLGVSPDRLRQWYNPNSS